MQGQWLLRISHGHEDIINGAYGNRSPGRHKSHRSNIVRDGNLTDTLDRRVEEYRYNSSSGYDRHHDCHHYHPYRRNDRGYFPDEFKKAKPPMFDGDVKKLEDSEAWILGMNNFFELHDYTDNMKAIAAILNLKGNHTYGGKMLSGLETLG